MKVGQEMLFQQKNSVKFLHSEVILVYGERRFKKNFAPEGIPTNIFLFPIKHEMCLFILFFQI